MGNVDATATKLEDILEHVSTVLDRSEWTTEAVEKTPHTIEMIKGKWTPATALKLAKHYGEAIDTKEAKKRGIATNTYTLTTARQCIEIAAWTACSNWRMLLWQEKTKPYKELSAEAARLEAKKSLAYKEAHCTMLSLQIGDTGLKIEQTELQGVEHFGAYYLTRLTATHENVHRAISIYSRGNMKDVFSTSKSVEIDGGQLTVDIARLMPEDARDKESVVHRLAIGFAPSDEVFDLWVRQQIDKLWEKYKGQVSNEELESLLDRLSQKALEAKERRDKGIGDEEKISPKDIAYFDTLLQKEIQAR